MLSAWPSRSCFVTFTLVSIAWLATSGRATAEPNAVGLHDVVVYDPGVHQRGLPSPQFKQSGKRLTVDIPPAVHVHRYYYSGDKEIQGPLIRGGPTVVVANHPKTGERMYIDVMLPAGAPTIVYNKSGITYVYPNHRVNIHFGSLPLLGDRVVVKQKPGRGWARSLKESHARFTQKTKEKIANSALAQSLKEFSGETGKVLKGATGAATQFGADFVDGAKKGLEIIPGVSTLKGYAKDAPQRKYAAEVRSAAEKKAREQLKFVPTNR